MDDGLTDKQRRFVELYRKKACNATEAAKEFKISRSTVFYWRRKSKVFDEAMKEVEAGIQDMAETALFSLIRERNITAIMFYLERKCGYKRPSDKDDNLVSAFDEVLRNQREILSLQNSPAQVVEPNDSASPTVKTHLEEGVIDVTVTP